MLHRDDELTLSTGSVLALQGYLSWGSNPIDLRKALTRRMESRGVSKVEIDKVLNALVLDEKGLRS